MVVKCGIRVLNFDGFIGLWCFVVWVWEIIGVLVSLIWNNLVVVKCEWVLGIVMFCVLKNIVNSKIMIEKNCNKNWLIN